MSSHKNRVHSISKNIMWKHLPFGEKCKCLARALSTSRKAFVKTNSRFSSSARRFLEEIRKKNHLQSCDIWHSHYSEMNKLLVTATHMNSLRDIFFHVFFTEVSCLRSTVPIKHSKVEHPVGQLGDAVAVFIVLALTNERGAAYLG